MLRKSWGGPAARCTVLMFLAAGLVGGCANDEGASQATAMSSPASSRLSATNQETRTQPAMNQALLIGKWRATDDPNEVSVPRERHDMRRWRVRNLVLDTSIERSGSAARHRRIGTAGQ